MKTLNIFFPHRETVSKIIIGEDLITHIDKLFDFSKYTSIYIITDSNVAPLYLEKIMKKFRTVYSNVLIHCGIFPAGEKNKSLETVQKIYLDLAKNSVDRKGLIVNIGGGVVTDLGGFVAATYLRGIDAVNISTSVTGMADASIGGKTGVDLNHWKNYIGAFYQPNMILMDIDALKTLPDRPFIEGFAEIIKHGLIADKKYFEFVSSKKPKDFSKPELIKIISDSVEIKKNIVEQDEQESGKRKLLNFGHTVGHAVESLSLETGHPLLHGEAVAIGMVAEAKISELLGNISEKDFKLIRSSIIKMGLPTKIPFRAKPNEIFMLLRKDKKNVNQRIEWVLLKSIGSATIDNEVPKKIFSEVITNIAYNK